MSYRIIIDDNPALNRVNKNYLYYPNDPRYTLNDIKLDLELGGAGQLQFTIYRDHPNYSMIELGYKHIFMYDTNDDTEYVVRTNVLFNGVISEMRRGVNREMTVYCTGVLGLLNYTIQPQKNYNGWLQAYVDGILREHNNRVDENEAACYRIYRGTLENYSQNVVRYTNYETTMDCLRRDVIEPLGLYPRLHYDQDFVYKFPLMDLVSLENYGSLSSQVIRIGENLVKYLDEKTIDNLYTAVIPLGKKKTDSERTSTDVKALDAYVDIRTVNNNDVVLTSDAAVAQYGFKCAVVHFEDITVPANLKTRAQAWLNTARYTDLNISLTAVDLSLMDADYDQFKLGDRVRCVIDTLGVDVVMPIYEMTIYPLEPEKNVITLGGAAPKITNSGSGGSNLRADADAMDTLGELIRIGQYQATYSVNAGQSVNITNADFSAVTPDGYTPIAVSRISSGNANALIRSFNPATASTSTVVQLRNIGSTNLTNQTCAITVLYAKSKVLAS